MVDKRFISRPSAFVGANEIETIYTRKALERPDRFSDQIAITSETGVGSSSLFKLLQDHFKGSFHRWISGGSLMRARGAELGMDINQFAKHNKLHPEEGHDNWCDQQIAYFTMHNHVICEGRLPHITMTRAFRVMLKCAPEIRAERRQRDNPEKNVGDVLRGIIDRDNDDISRYGKLYPGCIWTEDSFDLVIDTGINPKEDVVRILLQGHQDWLKDRDTYKESKVTFSGVNPHP